MQNEALLPIRRHRLTAVLAVVLAIVGVTVVLLATRRGVGLGSDSISYVNMAQNIAEGNGVMRSWNIEPPEPEILWPPFYPFIIAVPTMLGVPLLTSARWVGALLFGANILIVGLIVRRHTGARIWPPVTASLFVMSYESMLIYHGMAYSEQVFILLGVGGLALLADSFTSSRNTHLVFSAMAISLACLARYAGFALIVTGVMAIFLFRKGRFSRRMRDAFLFGATSTLPTLAWLGRNYLLAGSMAGRAEMEPGTLAENLNRGITAISGWLMPQPFTYWLAARSTGPGNVRFFEIVLTSLVLVGIVALFATVLRLRRFSEDKAASTLVTVLGLFILAAIVLVTITNLLFTSETVLKERQLLPSYVAIVISAVIVADGHIQITKRRGWPRAAVALMTVTILFLHTYTAIEWVRTSWDRGLNWSYDVLDESEIMHTADGIPLHILIYSNLPQPLYAYTGRPILPVQEASPEQMRERLADGTAVIVWLSNEDESMPADLSALSESLNLRVLRETSDGIVLGLVDF